MSAKGMFAAQAGVQMLGAMNSAFEEQAYAELQSDMMKRQMDEIDSRARLEIQNINQQAEKVVAAQETAFISAGVELQGSAMNVISDTLNDAAQAAYIRRRESDYDIMSLSIEKYQMDQAASDKVFFTKMLAAGLGAGAGYGKNMYMHNKGGGKQPSSSPFQTSDYAATSSNGGAGISAMNYNAGTAQGIA